MKTYYYNNYSIKHLQDSKGRIHYPKTFPINKIIKSENKSFIKLITQCLEWRPTKRITPSNALNSEWLSEKIIE